MSEKMSLAERQEDRDAEPGSKRCGSNRLQALRVPVVRELAGTLGAGGSTGEAVTAALAVERNTRTRARGGGGSRLGSGGDGLNSGGDRLSGGSDRLGSGGRNVGRGGGDGRGRTGGTGARDGAGATGRARLDGATGSGVRLAAVVGHTSVAVDGDEDAGVVGLVGAREVHEVGAGEAATRDDVDLSAASVELEAGSGKPTLAVSGRKLEGIHTRWGRQPSEERGARP
jgi:hypothetical protein